MGSWDGSCQVSGRSHSLPLSDPHVPLWNTDADAWNTCLHQSLTHRCYISRTKPLHCSKRWTWVLQGTFIQIGARRQWEINSTSFPQVPVMKRKSIFGISSWDKGSVFINSFVLLMGQNMKWNVLKISKWTTGIEHDAALGRPVQVGLKIPTQGVLPEAEKKAECEWIILFRFSTAWNSCSVNLHLSAC